MLRDSTTGPSCPPVAGQLTAPLEQAKRCIRLEHPVRQVSVRQQTCIARGGLLHRARRAKPRMVGSRTEPALPRAYHELLSDLIRMAKGFAPACRANRRRPPIPACRERTRVAVRRWPALALAGACIQEPIAGASTHAVEVVDVPARRGPPLPPDITHVSGRRSAHAPAGNRIARTQPARRCS